MSESAEVHRLKLTLADRDAEVAALKQTLKTAHEVFGAESDKLGGIIKALEQKLLASEVRGGELREVLEYVYHAIRSHSSVVASCRGAVGTMNEHEHHLQRGIDEIRKVLAKGTAHYSSQVEAIGKMVWALSVLVKFVDEERPPSKNWEIVTKAAELGNEALTTWNSLKGETEGK